MFEGEMASLEAIQKTNIVRVPQPIKVIDLPGGGTMFVMEYLKMKSLKRCVWTFLFLSTMFWGMFKVRKLYDKNLYSLRDRAYICYDPCFFVYIY